MTMMMLRSIVVFLLLSSVVFGGQEIDGDEGAKKDDSPRVMLLSQALAYLEEQRPGLALQLLTPLLERFPGDPTLRVIVGETYYALDDLPTAIEHFEAAIAIDETHRGRLFRLGLAYQKRDRLGDAQAVFEAMVREEEKRIRALGYFGLGLNRRLQGDAEEARKLFGRALELDPSAHRTRYRLAQLAFESGDFEAAEPELRVVIEHDPLHHGAAYTLALLLSRTDRDGKARNWMKRARAIVTGQERIQELRIALRKAPRRADLVRDVADVYRDLEAWKQATIWYQNALRRDPLDVDAALGLAAAHEKTGHRDKALLIYRDLAKRDVGAAKARLKELEKE